MRKPKSPRIKSILFSGAAIGGFAAAVACSTGPKSSRVPTATESSEAPAAPVIPLVIDVNDMSNGRDGRPSADPCTDFYRYSCGAWLDKTVIPADKKAVSRQVTAARDATDITLNKILVAYGRGDFSIPSKYAMKLSDFYNSCLSADSQTADSLAMVRRLIRTIHAAKSPADRARLVAKLKQSGVTALFQMNGGQDPNNSSKFIGIVGQGGLGLPNRDFYFNTDAHAVETREKYKAYIAELFGLLGETPVHSEAIASEILKFETELATKAYSAVEIMDVTKTNHPINQKGLYKLAPHFDWKTYFTALGIGKLEDLNARVPQYLQAEDQILQKTSKTVLDHYFTWTVLDSVATQMGGDFEKAEFTFRDQYLNGAKEQMPLWKRCTESVATNLGYPLTDAYVQTFDGEKIQERAEGMITEIKRSFSEDIINLTTGPDSWLDETTLKGAQAKIAKLAQKVGAPSKIPDYTSVRTTPGSYLQNELNVSEFESRRNLAKIGKPVDRTEWDMMPWEINAYYEPSNNEFVFAFGILQPPAFDLTSSDGVLYGVFGGGTIGHELTHGFDATGSKFNANGDQQDWWTPGTKAKFESRAQCFIDQANDYLIPETGLKVDGKLTIDENLADEGGVKLGYAALERILSKRPMAAEWNGYNERQQYWIAYAQSWCQKQTVESARQQMLTNEHPLNEFRVNQVLRNRPEFAKDFNCKVGSPMAPVKKCSLW